MVFIEKSDLILQRDSKSKDLMLYSQLIVLLLFMREKDIMQEIWVTIIVTGSSMTNKIEFLLY